MLIQLVFVLVAMFLLLQLSLGSGRMALLVMLNLPLALVSGIISVFLSGGTLSVPSLVGFILLFGIAVRNCFDIGIYDPWLVATVGVGCGRLPCLYVSRNMSEETTRSNP